MRVSVRNFVPNPRGLAELARTGDMQDATDGAGEAVAQNVRNQGIMVEHEPGDIALPVEVATAIVAGVAQSFVTIAHPSGEAVQAKHGSLTKAAAQSGLAVRGG